MLLSAKLLFVSFSVKICCIFSFFKNAETHLFLNSLPLSVLSTFGFLPLANMIFKASITLVAAFCFKGAVNKNLEKISCSTKMYWTPSFSLDMFLTSCKSPSHIESIESVKICLRGNFLWTLYCKEYESKSDRNCFMAFKPILCFPSILTTW